MDSASASLLLFWTIARAAGILVLATEAMILLARLRDEQRARGAGLAPAPTAPGARFFWAATPALLLAGLAAWSLASLAPRAATPGAVIALHTPSSSR
jgi:hypothetical protein